MFDQFLEVEKVEYAIRSTRKNGFRKFGLKIYGNIILKKKNELEG